MLWLICSLAVNAHAGTKSAAECYDLNSAKSCLLLAQELAAKSPERAKLARQRACNLGEKSACSAPAAPGVSAPPVRTTEVVRDKMILKRSEVDTEVAKLPSLLQDARLEAREHGFEFTQIEPKSVYERLGFRLGDILLEINGHTIEDSTQAMELFLLLRSESNFRVKLKRAGRVIERRYEIKE